MTWKPDICVYHGNCDDGFGAAWAVRHWCGESVLFVPAIYGAPIMWPGAIEGKRILFVDYSLKRDKMIELATWPAGVPNSIVILDHHKTAEAELSTWNVGPVEQDSWSLLESRLAAAAAVHGVEIVAHFDMQSSGARMAWDFFSRAEHNSAPPNLISLIEDQDLWRFSFGDKTRLFTVALRTYPQEFDTWNGLARDTDKLIAEGEPILRGYRKSVGQLCAQEYMQEIAGFTVPVVNAPYQFASDVAQELLQRHPEAAFAAAWFRRADGKRQYSLRSRDNRQDVSEIAKVFGGGGHRNAAGFEIIDQPFSVGA
jgi:oligoribonuclease NrnB/cAMP/cGMP phosphodiesterase (DHH superfamily)